MRGEEGKLKVAFQTFGCRSNYADTVDLQAAVHEAGAVACSYRELADVYVVNTCTVTDQADKDALRLIRKLKRQAPGAKIVVTGCMAEVSAKRLLEEAKADSVIGPGRKSEVLASIFGHVESSGFSAALSTSSSGAGSSGGTLTTLPTKYPNGRRAKRSAPQRKSISLLDPISSAIPGPGGELGGVSMRGRYHLRVQEGCEHSCTFCIIPTTRGRLSSRPVKDILADIEQLYKLGYREIVLTGTHLGGYGIDIGSSLESLMATLQDFSRIRRIRLSSIDPDDISRKIVELFAEGDVFCPHLHICVQALSDSLLKRMNRRHSMQDLIRLLDDLQERLPGACLGTDVIAGFPGESREEFEQQLALFDALPFAYLHVFPYSEREGTAAVALGDAVPYHERKRRSARWRAVGERKRKAFLQCLIGRELRVVVEREREGLFSGTSLEYASVVFPKLVSNYSRDTRDSNERNLSEKGLVKEDFDEASSSQVSLGDEVVVRGCTYLEDSGVLSCELLSQVGSA